MQKSELCYIRKERQKQLPTLHTHLLDAYAVECEIRNLESEMGPIGHKGLAAGCLTIKLLEPGDVGLWRDARGQW